jgi:hypothetical protein
MAMWRSKLGTDYPKEEMDRDEKKHKAELDRLRKLPGNRHCADCGANGTVWASVNLGVFLCMSCGSHHRGMGTHISLPKGCTGTYMWGPDEIERMAAIGNTKAARMYGGDDQRPAKTAPDSQWRQYIVDKYEHGKFMPKHPIHSPTVAATSRKGGAVNSPTTTSPSTSTISSPTQKKNTTPLPDWEHFMGSFSGSPTGAGQKENLVVKPAHHLSPAFPKSPHGAASPAKLGIRVTAPDLMEFGNEEGPFVLPSSTTNQQREKSSFSKGGTPATGSDFFGEFGL